MKVQGKIKMQTHPISIVVMDIAAFKVSHSVGFDKDATALRATRVRSSCIGAKCRRRFKCKNSHSAIPKSRAREQHPVSSRGRWKVTHGFDSRKSSPTATQHMATVSTPVGRWMKVQGKLKMQTHMRSCVVMDVAAFKVSHSAGCDIDATALRAARGEVKLHRGDG